ncbi:MAG: SDR family NAD(P)-dependent oxidoreductase [Proteobacteria bacterium]|jgi:NAD(P)-dependent dehydrogenase (short-subunit alcohol dehydrogenase family)|nr:SDR family NAD(P)-dependent oxidoreductase [Pseudomonadota bacterium]
MGLLEGKVALVTGAGGGLGEQHALLLAKEGAAVVVNDLGGSRDGTGDSTTMAAQVVSKIKKAGGRAVADYGNVAVEADAAAMVKRAVDEFGKIDFLIANAGILRDKSFKNMTEDLWDAVINVHLKGTYFTVKAAYDQMLVQETGGSIVVTSSTSGLLGNFGQTNYGAAKAGIAGLARCLFQEGLKYGIRVNILAPTAWSRMTADVLPEDQNMEDLLSPDKVSPLVVWLGSDEASDVTGRTFLVSGNNVQLISWQAQPIAMRSNTEGPWSVAEIGERVRENFEHWPKGIQPTRRGWTDDA